MKKQLLTLAMLAMTTFTFGQFAITSTSISFTGTAVPAGNTNGQFYSNQPNNNGGTMYSENTCNTPITQGGEPDEVGGFDPAVHSNPEGVTFYGGKIRTVFYGSPCTANAPSIGFNTGTSAGIGSGTNVNLSAVANQKVKFTYTSDATITFTLQLFDQDFNPKLDNGTTVTLNGDGNPHTVTLDFSSDIATGADLTNVRQVSLVYTSTTLSPNFGISLTDIFVGSTVVTSINSKENISKSTIYPNPSNGLVNVELVLNSSANVKVVLSDLYGREVKVVANGTYSTVNENFNVEGLTKGMYTVTYYLNNTPAKTEILMVN